VLAGQLLATTQLVLVRYVPEMQLLHAEAEVHVIHGLTQFTHKVEVGYIVEGQVDTHRLE
jgi:hypothetical protein